MKHGQQNVKSKPSFYLTVDTKHLYYKGQTVNAVYAYTNAVNFENIIEYVNTLCEWNA